MTWAARCAGVEARPIPGATSGCKWATLSERAVHLCFVACQHVVDNRNGGPHAPKISTHTHGASPTLFFTFLITVHVNKVVTLASEFDVSWSAILSGQLVKSVKRLEFRATVHVQKPNAGPNWPLLSDESAESLEEVEGARRKLELAGVSLSCPPCAPRAAALARCFASAICFSTRCTRAFTVNSSSGLFGDGLKPLFRGESFEAFVDSSKRTRSLRR